MSAMSAMSRHVPAQARGAVLFVALIMLLLLTLLGVTAAQVTVLQQRMSGSFRVQQVAFERAEGRMAEGRDLVANPLLVFDTVSSAPAKLTSGNEAPWQDWLETFPPAEYPPDGTTMQASTDPTVSVRACGGACPQARGSATAEDPNKKPRFYVLSAQQKDPLSDAENAAWSTVQTIYVY
ncbi:MAG TPA: PilX N-terminal domain-containing pilus assembly protein [Rhodanobacteraceae bacterium]|nr:PilX N-terminal domain-containing pilus assembly protein [Rhodanobacteraceae bacterium]